MKPVFCVNCGVRGHIKNDCSLPIVSYGIILLNIQTDNIYIINEMISNLQIPPLSVDSDSINLEPTSKIDINSEKDLKLFCELRDSIQFLLVQRKHTLGYLEFMRGRYTLDNPRGIEFIFKQMVQAEINDIEKKDFDNLWESLWGTEKAYKSKEYFESKDKFNKLRNSSDESNNLAFYTANIAPLWKDLEWGFPKGRRCTHNESTMKCAIREFKEETGLGDEDFIILNKIKPIGEEFYGTDGIKYKHVYFLAVSTSNKLVEINKNNKNQIYEIGDIRWFNIEETIDAIRPYHKQRRQLVMELFMYIINYINTINIKNTYSSSIESK